MLTSGHPDAFDRRPSIRSCGLFLAATSWCLAAVVGAQRPTFEVASIKPAAPNPASPVGRLALVMPQPGGRLTAANATLARLVEVAYGVEDFQVTGGPPWVTTARFDIVAKAPSGDATLRDMRPMLRALLAERFRLHVRTERRQLPAFVLLPARENRTLGPHLKASSADCSASGVRCGVAPFGASGAFGLRGTGQPMSVVVRLISQALGRSVIDETGLEGRYDFELTFDPSALTARAAQAGVPLPPDSAAPASDNPSLGTALQEQLGLKLENERRMVAVVIIESAEMPVTD